MADDSNNQKMDEMLRTYASKRRDGPELPLHPATRRMLQDEVRRVRGGAAPESPAWRRWWPQIAFGCALLVVMGIAAVGLRSGSRPAEMEMAQVAQEDRIAENFAFAPTAEEARKAAEPAPKDAFTSDPAVELRLTLAPPVAAPALKEESEQLAGASSDARNLARADSAPAPEARRPDETADPLAFYRKNPELMRRYFPHLAAGTPSTSAVESTSALTAAAAPPQVSPLRQESASRLNELTNLGAAARTRFVQTNAQPTVPILRSFQLEQLGEQIRLVDADGSIYLGEMTELTSVGTTAAGTASAPQAFSVLATGRSVTLGREVTLQGSYFPRTNLPTIVRTSRQSTRPEPAGRGLAPSATPPRAAIVGRATIEGTNNVPVNAISLER